jgi:microcystin-dependent protein
MAETLTVNYGWTKPDPGASANTWGTTLNAATDAIDAQVFLNAQAGLPVGSGTMWFAAAPPANWLICNGQSLSTSGTYAALFAVLGTAFNQTGDAVGTFRVPNMAARMPIGVGSATINDVQTLSLSGGPTGGSFTLAYAGQTTAAIAWNALAANVQAALVALSSIGSGNVACTGGPLPGAVTITFQGTLGNSSRPTIVVAANNLTGGAAPQPNIVHTTIGSGAAYALAATGGAAAIALDATMIPTHSHTITDPTHTHTATETAHTHGVTDPTHSHTASQTQHSHTVPGSFGFGFGANQPPNPLVNTGTTATTTAQPAISVDPNSTGIAIQAFAAAVTVAAHATGITGTNNVGGGLAHQNMPPWLAINFIIKFA